MEQLIFTWKGQQLVIALFATKEYSRPGMREVNS